MTTEQPAHHARDSAADRAAIRAMFAAAAEALDGAGIRWCRLRAVDEAGEDDLLVESIEALRLNRVLATAGFAPIPRLARGSHREYHAVDPVTGSWAKLDVVTRIDLGPYQEVRTGLAEGFLSRRSGSSAAGPGDSTLDPDDAFWALLLHELWDRASPVIRREASLRLLAGHASADGPAARAVRGLLPSGEAPERVIALARSGDTVALIHIGRRMRGRPELAAIRRRTIGRFLRWVDRRDPPFVRRGLSVALLGPDGTGKSTLSAALGAGGPLPVRSVYLGLYGGNRRRSRRRAPRGPGLAGRLLRMWRGWLIGWLHVTRGRLVVFDRHPFDARLPVIESRRPPIGRRLLARSVPAPDLTVLLDAPPEVLFARKPEHPIERLADQRTGYLALASRLPGAVVIDVNRPAAAVAPLATAVAWKRYLDRTGLR